MEAKNIYQKMQLVSCDIKNIEKNMVVGDTRYQYKAVSDYDVVTEINRAEAKHGLISIPVRQDLVRSEIVKVTSKDGRDVINYVDIVKLTMKIINIDSPSEIIEVEAYGRGLDSGDKGFGKASTYARKYALLNAYKIATGEDPDKYISKEQNPSNNDYEVKRSKVIKYMLDNDEYFSAIMKHYSTGSVDDLSMKQILAVYKNLTDKKLI